ncbi:MAG: hypothetical protein R3Y26_03430 [Rikenellaceae bacterium]
MEKRVNLSTRTKFEITDEEKKYLYTLMALTQYSYNCNPEYNENVIIKRLCNDFNRFNIEISRVFEKDPNNLCLSRLRNFIERHYGYLKKISKDLEIDD